MQKLKNSVTKSWIIVIRNLLFLPVLWQVESDKILCEHRIQPYYSSELIFLNYEHLILPFFQ